MKASEAPLGRPSKYMEDSLEARESATAIPRLSAAAAGKLRYGSQEVSQITFTACLCRPLNDSSQGLKSTTAGGRWKQAGDDTVFLAMHDGRQLRAGKAVSKALSASASLRSLSESTSGALKPLPPHHAPRTSLVTHRAVSPLTSGHGGNSGRLRALRPLSIAEASHVGAQSSCLKQPGISSSTMQLPPAAFAAPSAPTPECQQLMQSLLQVAQSLTPRRLKRLLAQANHLGDATTQLQSPSASALPRVVSSSAALQHPSKPASSGTASGSMLHLNVLSTHGDAQTPTWLGLTEIQVYAALPSVMPLTLGPHSLSLSGAAMQPARSAAGRAATRRLPRLCNGAFKTSSEDDMFLAQLRPVASHSQEPLLTVTLQLPASAGPPRAVVIWNWNCSSKAEGQSSLAWGARAVTLTDGSGTELWRGELPLGTGDAHTQTGLSIPLSSRLVAVGLNSPARHSLSDEQVEDVSDCSVGSAASPAPPPRSPDEGGAAAAFSPDASSTSSQDHESEESSVRHDLLPSASLLSPDAGGARPPHRAFDALETSLEHLQQFALHQPGRLALPDHSARQEAPVDLGRTASDSASDHDEEHPVLQNDARPASAGGHSMVQRSTNAAQRPPADSHAKITSVLHYDSSSSQQDEASVSVPVGAASPGELEESLSTSFALVPHCPRVQELQLQLISTWGDPHLVGLAGLQLFDAQGVALDLCSSTNPRQSADGVLTAQPAGVQDMPGFEADPRTVDNLVDGQYMSMDELKTWLAPWSPGQPVTLTIRLQHETAIGCVRIWNYNTDRAHNTRGVKRLRILADGKPVFTTNVKQAPGSKADASQLCDTVLFTMDKAAVQRIHKHDLATGIAGALQHDGTNGVVWRALRRMAADRPSTAEKSEDLLSQAEAALALSEDALQFQTPPRYRRQHNGGGSALRDGTGKALTVALPAEAAAGTGQTTAHRAAAPLVSPAANLMSPAARAAAVVAQAAQPVLSTPQRAPPSAEGGGLTCFDRARGGIGQPYDGGMVPHARVLDMWIMDTHGDPWYVGLTGLTVLVTDADNIVQPVQLSLEQVMAQPCDINTQGHHGDDRTLDKLIDGVNVTQDDTHMWLIPYTPPPAEASGRPLGEGGQVNQGEHLLRIDLGCAMPVAGIMVWNYNKHSEGWQRGARRVYLTLDGDHVAPPAQSPSTAYYGDTCVWLRRAPDCAEWDFAQVLRFGARRVAPHGALQACVLDDGAAGAAAGHTWAWLDAGGRNQRLLKKASSVPGMLPGQFMAGFNVSPNPCGSLLQLKLLSSQGDPFYVGLHGVALLDAAGQRVKVSPLHLHATPGTAAAVSPSDARQVGNLCYITDAAAASHPLATALRPSTKSAQGWLAPLSHSLGCPEENCVTFALDQPVAFGGIVVYNYGKTPARGAGGYELWLDGNLLVSGQLLPGDAAADKPLAQIIAFNSDIPKAVSSAVGSFGGASIVLTSRDALEATGQTGTGVVRCVDEGRVVEAGNTRTAALPTLGVRPSTAIPR